MNDEDTINYVSFACEHPYDVTRALKGVARRCIVQGQALGVLTLSHRRGDRDKVNKLLEGAGHRLPYGGIVKVITPDMVFYGTRDDVIASRSR